MMDDPALWWTLATLSIIGAVCWIIARGEEQERERLDRIEREHRNDGEP